MKSFWKILSVTYVFIIIIVFVTGFYKYLFGKILLGFIAGLITSSIMKVIRKNDGEE